MFRFKKPKNELELMTSQDAKKMHSCPNVPDEMYVSCPSCKTPLLSQELCEKGNVCIKCGHHFSMNVRQRINFIFDKNTFVEINANLKSVNLIDFPGYDKKLENAKLDSSENEAVITGIGEIGANKCAVFVMNGRFMMGSMGSIVGEKITQLFEYATKNKLPVIGFTVSGGARMQEGVFSLMQMAKTSGAVKKHSDAGLLYVTVLTNPTTGGVTASFAMEGDIIIAEPNALICFAGPRVVEQTTRQKLPAGFQKAEFLLEKGFVDDIVPRHKLKEYLSKILLMHHAE